MCQLCGQDCSTTPSYPNDDHAIKQQQFEQYKRVAEAMAQDLREYADAAQEAGDSILVTETLLDEFDVVANQMNGFGKG